MAIDNKTKVEYLRFSFEDNKDFKDFLEEGRKTAEEEGLNQDDNKSIQLYTTNNTPEEFYYDGDDNKLYLTGSFDNGDFSLAISLSDEVLIDILNAGIKKFNKLKTALETLK